MQDHNTVTIIIHFLCGFVFGFLALFATWMGLVGSESMMSGLVASLISGVVVGIIAAIYLDQFWQGLKDQSWWWPF